MIKIRVVLLLNEMSAAAQKRFVVLVPGVRERSNDRRFGEI